MQFEGVRDKDAFDNAETLFRNAFSLPDPTPELLNLMNANPTQVAAVDLLVYYTNSQKRMSHDCFMRNSVAVLIFSNL